MIELTFQHEYVVCDTDEWVADRVAGINEEATEAYETFTKDKVNGYESEWLLEWLQSLSATGIYNEDGPVQVCTCNEENFLSDDGILTFANTDAFGTLFIWQEGIYKSSTPVIYTFNGDDDAEALGWASGGASCNYADSHLSGGAYCDADLIIQSACELWQNGGVDTYDIAALSTNDEGQPICPRCNVGTLTFWAY